MASELRNFLALSYDELEQLNLQAKEQRKKHVAPDKIQEDRIKYLADQKAIKAVTVLFSDLEGRLHMLDYDKKFLVKSWDNLTFDGSSIRGFTAQRAAGLQDAKEHPQVAASQLEINYIYGEVVAAADEIQLYKLICRQVATKLGLTACFLPKRVVGLNGNGMHTNVSISKGGNNL